MIYINLIVLSNFDQALTNSNYKIDQYISLLVPSGKVHS